MVIKIAYLPSSFQSRKWQERAILDFESKNPLDYLVCAYPGTGKTYLAGALFYKQRAIKAVEKMVVVVHTDHLKGQWIDSLHKNFGIDLTQLNIDPWTGELQDIDSYDGLVVSYQQLKGHWETIFGYVARNKVFAVFDEIHHCGEPEADKTWSKFLQKAFDNPRARPVHRLALSGTPWRSDYEKIPFIKYTRVEGGWTYHIDFEYSYGEALAVNPPDCSDVIFMPWDGIFEWEEIRNGEQMQFRCDFSEKLDDFQSRRRLNTAIEPKFKWLPKYLEQANIKLDELRHNYGHKDAGGLVVCKGIDEAREIDKILRRMGEDPVVVVSEDIGAKDQLKDFDESGKKWLIAVRMVSEGVDITRLRVCVYATNIITEMFFIQVLGRIIRYNKDLQYQTAFFWVPNTPELRPIIQKIKDTIEAFLRERIGRENGSVNGTQLNFWFPQAATDAKSEGFVTTDGHFVDETVISLATNYFADKPHFTSIPVEEKVKVYMDLTNYKSKTTQGFKTKPSPDPSSQPLEKRKHNKGTEAQTKANKLARALHQSGYIEEENPYWFMNDVLGKLFGYGGKHSLTEEDLDRKIAFLNCHLKKWSNREFNYYDFINGKC